MISCFLVMCHWKWGLKNRWKFVLILVEKKLFQIFSEFLIMIFIICDWLSRLCVFIIHDDCFLFSSDDEESKEASQDITIHVLGMKCMSCVRKITGSLGAKKGVISVQVSVFIAAWISMLRFIVLSGDIIAYVGCNILYLLIMNAEVDWLKFSDLYRE